MFTQLTRLSIEADGRYATAEELKFLKDYLQSFEKRLSAYQKIQAAQEKIIKEVAIKMQAIDPEIFQKGKQDVSQICQRDREMVLKYSTAALLSNDLERLQDGLLYWLQTIVRAFSNQKAAEITYQVMAEVIRKYLTPEEAALLEPIFELNRSLGK